MSSPYPKPWGPGRPKDLEKRAAILNAAKHLFPENGFEGTSMDAIAASAGVSKLTVYSHFRDKESLFTEAVRARCTDLMPAELFEMAPGGATRDRLLMIARAFFTLITRDESIALHRLLTAGTGTSQKLAQMFWQAGPQTLQEGLAGFLRREVERGRLEIADVARAASQFYSLLKGELHARLLCGCCAMGITDAEVEAHLSATIDLFMRAYGRRENT